MYFFAEPAPAAAGEPLDPNKYQPFKRGRFPCGVRTLPLTDPDRAGRLINVEVYYPADEAVRGRDISSEKERLYDIYLPLESQPPQGQQPLSQAAVREPPSIVHASSPFPLLIFSHGELQSRRHSNTVLTHLASHGYIVLALDCSGDTWEDLVHDTDARLNHEPRRLRPLWRVDDRVLDIGYVLKQALLGLAGVPREAIRAEALGVLGVGVGATAALTFAKANDTIKACLALAPSLGLHPLASKQIVDLVHTQITRPLPTLYLCAKQDSFHPFDDRVRDYFKGQVAAAQNFAPAPITKMVAMDKACFAHFTAHPDKEHEMVRTAWPMLKLPGVSAEANSSNNNNNTRLDYAALVQTMLPYKDLLPAANVHAVIVTLSTAFFDSQLLKEADQNQPKAEEFMGKVLEGKLYNVDLEVDSA